MKTMQRIWWFILGIGITALGAYLIVEDPTMRGTGIMAVVVGLAVTGAMGFILFGQKTSE